MCGIAGSIINTKLTILKVSQLLNLMRNRGPDNQAFKELQINKKNCTFFLQD